MLSSRIRSQPASSSSRSWSRSVTSTSTGRSGWAARTASNAGTHATGREDVVVLDHRHVAEAEPVVDPAAAADGVLLQRAPAGQRLAGVEHAGPGALERRRPSATVAVATPERCEAKLRAVRSAVSSPRVGPETRITTSPASTRVPSGSRSVTSTSSPQHVGEDQRGDAEAGHDAVLAGAEVGRRPGVRRDGGRAGDVLGAVGQVLLRAPARIVVVDRARVEPGGLELGRAGRRGRTLGRRGRSSRRLRPTVGAGVNATATPEPSRVRRRSGRTSAASSRSGKSSRQCEPRVSSRSRAASASAVLIVTRLVASQARGADLARLVGQRGELLEGVREAVGGAQHAGLLGHHGLQGGADVGGDQPRAALVGRPARRTAAARRAAPARSGARRPGPRAASWRRAGWRRARRSRRPRRWRRGRGRRSGPTGRWPRRPRRSGRPARPGSAR